MFAFSEGLQVFACQKKKKKLKKNAKFLKFGNSFLKKTFEKRVLFLPLPQFQYNVIII